MYKLILAFTIIVMGFICTIYSCDGNKKIDGETIKFKFPIVNDTLSTERADLVATSRRTGNYNPLYIGNLKNSIELSYTADLTKYFLFDDGLKRRLSTDTSGITLHVDTTTIVSNRLSLWWEEGSDFTRKFYKAYPVFMVNTTNDTLNIGYGDYFPIIMEALDYNNKWRPIEENFIYMCGNGLNTIILPPHEIAITSALIYKGSFTTKLRLRYYNIYSQEFYGSINRDQFQS